MTFARSIRLDYIDWRVAVHGSVRRQHIQETFDVSQAQASQDLTAFRETYPDALRYDLTTKQYVPARNTYRSQRKTDDPDFRRGLTYLRKAGHPMGWE